MSEQVVRLQKNVGELVEAARGLAHDGNNCWCLHAIGHPQYSDHSDACKKMRTAIANIVVKPK